MFKLQWLRHALGLINGPEWLHLYCMKLSDYTEPKLFCHLLEIEFSSVSQVK